MTKLKTALGLLCCAFLISFPANGQTVFKRPADAANVLYSAWRTKNRSKAGTAAEPAAVEKLFSVRRRTMRLKGCTKREEGDFECIYENRKNDLTMAMLTRRARHGYHIASLSFSSEAY